MFHALLRRLPEDQPSTNGGALGAVAAEGAPQKRGPYAARILPCYFRGLAAVTAAAAAEEDRHDLVSVCTSY